MWHPYWSSSSSLPNMKAIHWRIKVTYNFEKKVNPKVNLGRRPTPACPPAACLPGHCFFKGWILKKNRKLSKKYTLYIKVLSAAVVISILRVNNPKYCDRQIWASSVECGIRSESTLFASHPEVWSLIYSEKWNKKNKSCQKTTQLARKGWSEKKTIFRY